MYIEQEDETKREEELECKLMMLILFYRGYKKIGRGTLRNWKKVKEDRRIESEDKKKARQNW